MSKKHYRRSPSGASRAMNCPASVYIDGTDNERSSSYADEGTRAHDAAERWIAAGVEPEDAEVRESVRPYVEHVLRLQNDCLEQAIEETIESSRLDDWGGTADCVTLSECGTVAWVDDLKYGQGVRVLAEGNDQLMSYASLWSERWQTVETWFLSIWQPRVPGPPNDTVEVSAKEVNDWFARYAERTAPENAGEFAAGDWCRWCRAVSTCPHLYQLAQEKSRLDFGPVNDISGEVSAQIDRWQELLRLQPALNAAFKAAAANLLSAAEAGHKVPGRKLVQKYGNRRWRDTSVLTEVCKQAGIPLAEVTKTEWTSPAAWEKKGYLDLLPEHLVERPETGRALAELDDSRPAVSRNADEDFDAVD